MGGRERGGGRETGERSHTLSRGVLLLVHFVVIS